MSALPILTYTLKSFWSMVRHRKAWLRMHRIDYTNGLMSERTYKFGRFMINGAVFLFYDFWVMVVLFILGPIYFF